MVQISTKLCRNQRVTVDSTNLTPGVLVQISVLEESVYDEQCIATAQLQQEPSIVIYFSIIMLALSHFSIGKCCFQCVRVKLPTFGKINNFMFFWLHITFEPETLESQPKAQKTQILAQFALKT